MSIVALIPIHGSAGHVRHRGNLVVEIGNSCMAIAYRRIDKSWLTKNGGNFTLFHGRALRGKRVEMQENESDFTADVALPLVVVNEEPDINLGDYLMFYTEGGDPLEYVEVDTSVPFSSMTAIPVYFVNVSMEHNAVSNNKTKSSK